MKDHETTIVLDLEEVTLVDVDVVRFLDVREAEGAICNGRRVRPRGRSSEDGSPVRSKS
ncbi:MAG: hypothetical protein WBV55_02185 [Candidatus Sulfotelmatobacter sp.]